MRGGLRPHVFVDEGKAREYIMVAAYVAPLDLSDVRKMLRSQLLRGQRRIHFNHERDARRKQIVRALTDTGVKCRVYCAGSDIREADARSGCLRLIVRDVRSVHAELMVVETDDPAVARDRMMLRSGLAASGGTAGIRYEHRRPHEECLLWIPDAVAWCWARGAAWRQLISPMIERVERV